MDYDYQRVEDINLDADFLRPIHRVNKKKIKKDIIKKGDKFFEENTPWKGFLKIISGKGPYGVTDHLQVDIPSIYTQMFLEQYRKTKKD